MHAGKLNQVLIQFIMVLAGTLSGPLPVLVAQPHTANSDNYLAKLKTLKPGNHLRLVPGEYKDGLPIQYLLVLRRRR